MEWIVLGSGTTVPDKERGSAAHVLRGDGVAALFDCGSGTKDRLARAEVDFGELTHLVHTHTHLDHWLDLLSLLFHRSALAPSDRRAGIVIAGPPGFCEYVRRIARLAYPPLLDDNADAEWRDISPREPALDAGWFRARAYEVWHGMPSAQAYRIEGIGANGREVSVCYSGDSGYCDGLVTAARGVDCLVCECSLPESKGVAKHLTPALVRRLADAASPRRVVLTHLYPEVLRSGEIEVAFGGYGGKVVVGHDGLVIPL